MRAERTLADQNREAPEEAIANVLKSCAINAARPTAFLSNRNPVGRYYAASVLRPAAPSIVARNSAVPQFAKLR